jgi:CheY-like chemotaxis protein
MASSSAKHSILIVDDTPGNIAVLVDYLSEAGFKVLVARDTPGPISFSWTW